MGQKGKGACRNHPASAFKGRVRLRGANTGSLAQIQARVQRERATRERETRCLAKRIHALGPRVLAELLIEFEQAFGARVRVRLQVYARLPVEFDAAEAPR